MRCGHCQNYLDDETTSMSYCLTCGGYICPACISAGTSHTESSTDDLNDVFEQTESLCTQARRGGDNAISDGIKPTDKQALEKDDQADQKSLDAKEFLSQILDDSGLQLELQEHCNEQSNVQTDRVSEKIIHIRDTITVKDRQTKESTSSGSENQNTTQNQSSVPSVSLKEIYITREGNLDQSSDRENSLCTENVNENQNIRREIKIKFEGSSKSPTEVTCNSLVNITVPFQVPLEHSGSQSTGKTTDMHLKLVKKDIEGRVEEEILTEQESGYGSQNLLQSSSEILGREMKDYTVSKSETSESDKHVKDHQMNGNIRSDKFDEENSVIMTPETKPIRGKSASVGDPVSSVVMRRSRKTSPERRFTRGLSRSSSLPDLLKSATEMEKRKSVMMNSSDKLSKSTEDLLDNDKRNSIPFQMCGKDHKAPPAYICFKDNEIYCKVCVQIHNLHCHEKVKFIPEIPPETRTKACDDSLRELLSAKERFNHVKGELCADLQLLKDNRKEYVIAVMRFKQSMIKIIDEIEKEALADMDLIFNLEKDKFQKNLTKLESCISEIEQMLEELKVRESNEDNSIFYNIQSVSKFVTESELDLHGIHKSCFKTEFSFQPQDTITSLSNNSDSLWTIKLSKDVKCHAPYPCTCDRSYKYRKAEFDKQFSAKLSGWSSDKDKCYISGCEFLQNGNLLLADNHNKKVKMFDKKYRCVSALSLSSLPWDIAVLDKHLAVVSIPDKKQLQFFETKHKLSSKHSVFLEKNCWGVARANELLVVTCWSRDISEVLVMDTEGFIKRTIMTANRTPFNIPWYVSVSNDSIRVSDWGSNKVTFITITGEFIGQYTDNGLVGAMGAFSDPEGNMYVCARDTNSIHQVGSDGGKVQTILTERDGIEKPLCVCHCQLDNRFVVTSWMSDTVQVYRLV